MRQLEATADPGTAVIHWPKQLVVGNRQELKALAYDCDKNLLIDLSQSGYIDASGLGVLVKVAHHVRDCGKKLVLVGLNADLKDLFELTKLSTLFRMADTEPEALDLIANSEAAEAPVPVGRRHYQDNDLLDFEEARAWWGCGARTLERMNLPWSFPTRGKGGGRFRRIMFKDLVAHYERRKIG